MMRNTAIVLALLCSLALIVAQGDPAAHNPLLRQYHGGEVLAYRMQGTNDTWHYSLRADGVVMKDPAGPYFEEYRWSTMLSNGQAVTLSPASAALRQEVSLDPGRN